MKPTFPKVIAVTGTVLFSLCAVAVVRADPGDWEPAGLAGESVRSLAFDPGSPSTMYATTATGVYKTTDGGARWTSVSHGLPASEGGRLRVTSAGIFTFSEGGLFRSTDGGNTWQLARGLGRNHSFFGFDAFGSNLYLGQASCQLVRFDCAWAQGILWRSDDGGRNWSATGLLGDIVQAVAIDPLSPATVYAAVTGPERKGVYQSSDGGASFAATSGILAGQSFSGIAVSQVAPSILYASRETGIFRSRDGGASWESANGNLPPGGIVLALDPTSAATLYATTGNGGLFRTTDGGDNWSPIATGIAGSRVTAATVDPSSPSTIYAGTFADGVHKLELPKTSPCVPAATALCLNKGRFRVEVGWVVARPLDAGGAGRAVPLTGDTGAFWFFSASNLELMVKVLDGRGVNGHFWFFWGALSDVSYGITVTDTRTGQVRTYTNPPGRLESRADIEAF